MKFIYKVYVLSYATQPQAMNTRKINVKKYFFSSILPVLWHSAGQTFAQL